jgi:hypothetical protein
MRKAARQAKGHSAPRGNRETDNEKISAALAAVDKMEAASPEAAAVAGLLKSWLTDESGYDEETWPKLKEALDRERRRIGARDLFRG